MVREETSYQSGDAWSAFVMDLSKGKKVVDMGIRLALIDSAEDDRCLQGFAQLQTRQPSQSQVQDYSNSA
jgi:hypothetical protein